MTALNWTDDRVEHLKCLWQEGLSASQVAAALGGVTRNAVIGKVHRLGLAGRGDNSQTIRPRVSRAPRPSRSVQTAVVLVEVDPLPLADGSFATMQTIDKPMCRWPIGDPMKADFHFCGQPHKEGSPYCEVHAARAHRPSSKAKAGVPVQRRAA